MLKKVRVRIVTDREELLESLFEGVRHEDAPREEREHMEMTVEARYHDDGSRVSIAWDESDASGMEGSRTTIAFQKAEPHVISMLRTGSVKTALLFEKGRCHECVYQTPLAPFDVRVQTERVHNAVETMGTLDLEYIVQMKGAEAEQTKMRIVILRA
jgi:uncharacterized beta-barrel protein YwiB (DUF1934 family)